MAARTELRGFLKQSQRTSELADAAVPSNLNSTGRATVKESQNSVTGNEIRVRSKRSSRSRKQCVSESLEHNSDELVKYMSKLPGYLQRIESGEESVQSNVLNVGVLDWGRLEKWKHGRARDCSSAATTSTSGVVPDEDDQVRIFPNLGKGKASRDLQHSELASRDSLNKQEIATCSYKSSCRGHHPGKSRRSGSYQESTSGLLSDMGNSGGSLGTKGDLVWLDKETQKRAGMIHAQAARARAAESVEDLDGEEKINGDLKSGLASGNQENQISNIVLLRSRKQSGSTLSGESQISLDDNMRRVAREVTRSLDLYEGINSSLELTSQIPRSCPLSIDLERDSEDMRLPLGVDVSGKKERFVGRSHSKTASRIFDQEMPEDESRLSRHHSPSKRFSFSFGRLSKSFSSKEDFSADNIIKSDSMRFDGSVCPSQSSNPDIQCGSRVSPLRRLLDHPLLKSKGSENVLPSKERSCSSNPKPTNIQDEKKQDTSRTRALFQLTIRNGIPLFQFVVDDNGNSNNNNKKKSSRSILGATMKSSASSFKDDDTVHYCTFYSVEEAKKKKSGSWLIHGHKKEKQGGFVYSVIGQMRLSSYSLSSDITEKKSGNISPVIAESVLFDGSEQLTVRKEIAAVVIKKKPVEETSVIIPDGDHSFPEKGAPSPLISRWRSGGICDCGGWDVGCKLRVLSNKSILHELEQSFKLYDQEGSEDESGPALAMTELKTGIYRVEFGSFLSHLQAFFVCVTVVTCALEEESVSKTTVKSSSPFAPPLSPVGRV